jgi:hypothetical protein
MREDMAAWVGCISGAVDEETYLQMMRDAGFTDVKVVDKMTYDEGSLNSLFGDAGCCSGTTAGPAAKSQVAQYAGKVSSVKVYARKPE